MSQPDEIGAILPDPGSGEIISFEPADQLALWAALNESSELSKAQKELGAVMRGEG